MKKNELRIGNYVLYENEEIQIDIDCFYWSVESSYAELEYWEQYKPIPITDEWLLKFGFKVIKNYNNGLIGFKDFNLLGDENLYYYTYDNHNVIGVGLKYVHQLQNLYFALTGEELFIKEETPLNK